MRSREREMAARAMPEVSSAAVRQSVSRILASEGFRRAPALRKLLSYVIDAVLEGRAQQIKEYSLGVAVFGRGEGFDSRCDPIVRVQARRMRARLEKYYQ